MNVVTLPFGWYPDDINSKLDFDDFKSPSQKEVLFVGISCTEIPEVIRDCKRIERSVYVNLEHPCTLYGPKNEIGLDPLQQQTIFNEVYTICPYTAKWFNELNLGTKFYAMPYPHNLTYDIYGNPEKQYDVAYCGLIHSDEIASYINAMKNHNYFFSTITDYNRVTSVNELATHNNIPNIEKWKFLATTRSSVIQNNLYLNEEHIKAIKSLPNWQDNEAFSHVDTGLLPQLKSRTVESAICKSLMLVKKDPWNVIEYWFKPNEDFVYFEDAADLDKKITEIKNNWSDYEPMVESAYKKVVEKYNTKYIFEKIKNGEPIE